MLVADIESAQERTREDFEAGVKWSTDRLGKPHLPYKITSYRNHDGLDRRLLPTILPPTMEPFPGVEVGQSDLDFVDAVFHKWPKEGTVLEAMKHVSDTRMLDGLYIEDMPIKVPGGKIVIPDVIYWNKLRDILEMCFMVEEDNPHANEQYFYLTIQQSWVKAGTVQRIPGLHLDGFQKASIVPQVAQHQLAITNTAPTEFVAHSYDTSSFPVGKSDLFKELTRQSEGHNRYKPSPYQLHLLNAFCPHAPGIAQGDCFRTFIRLSASTIPFMREGNTKNPFLPLDWNEENKKKFYDSIAA